MGNSDIIISRGNKILDETKNKKEDFYEERKIIFKLLDNPNDENIEILGLMEDLYYKVYKLKQESDKYKQVELLINKLEKQHTRKADFDTTTIHTFSITDKNNNVYNSFIRGTLKEHIEMHKENFNDDEPINVCKIRNLDIEKLINIVKES